MFNNCIKVKPVQLFYLISISLLFLSVVSITGCIGKQEKGIKSRIEHIDHILNNNPDDVKALTDLGNLYYDMRQYSKAILYYSRILVLTPENVNVRTDMGTCYKILGYLKKAEKEYIKSLQIDPNHLKTNFNLGIILYKMNRKKEAVEWHLKHNSYSFDDIDADNIFDVNVSGGDQAAE